MTAKTERDIARIIHFIGAAGIGSFVYSPWGELEAFRAAVQVFVMPGLTLSGLWLWKGHKIKQWFRKSSGSENR